MNMKKLLILLGIGALLFALPAWGEGDFELDEQRVYSGMGRSYLQGYAPTVKGDELTVILPVLSDRAQGTIEAEVVPHDMAHSPIKPQTFKKSVKRESFRFGKEKVSAYRVAFKLKLHGDRQNGEYPFSVVVTGKDEQGQLLSQTFELEAAITDGQAGHKPQPVIQSARIQDGYIQAGTQGILRLELKNQSDYRTAELLSAVISEAEGNLIPAEGDWVELGRLAAGEEKSVEVELLAPPKAEAGLHTLKIVLNYQDAQGAEGTLTQNFPVEVRKSVRLEHSDPSLPIKVTQGETPAFRMDLMNMGASVLSNVLLKFDLPGLSSGGSVLVGAINPGETRQANANFRVDQQALGPVQGGVTISYEDEYGQTHEQTLDLSTTIEQKKAAPVAVEEGQEEEQGEALKLAPEIALGIIAALAAALIVQGIVLRKKIRRLEEKNL